jgi:hypothetical protein
MATMDTSLNVNQAFKEYKWLNSCNVPVEIKCGICRLELPIDMKVNSEEVPPDIYVNAQIVSDQVPLHECPVSTFFGDIDETKNYISWDDILSFPLNFRDLSHDAILVITAWSGEGTLFGGTTMRFFDDNGVLKRGKQKLAFYFNRPGDPNVIISSNSTPANLHDIYSDWDCGFQMEKLLESYRNSTMTTEYTSRKRLDWLDRLTVTRIEAAINDAQSIDSRTLSADPNPETFWGRPTEELDLLHFCFLVIELPTYPYPVSIQIFQ